MIDRRLEMLTNYGIATSQVEAFQGCLPEEVLDRIGKAKTPREAKRVLLEGLAEHKAEVEGIPE